MQRTLSLALTLGLTLILAGQAGAQQIEARLDRTRMGVGETTNLRVTVRGSGSVRAPEFEVPEGLRVLGTGRQQNFSWVNGRAASETEFRSEIVAEAVGSFTIGPIDVVVGSKTFRSGTVTLEVLEAPPVMEESQVRSGGVPATLDVSVEPREPYVGQAMTLRVRLVQRTA